jgi:hypothetical protein
MAEFNVVATAKNSPTECLFCGDFTGPFLDTYIELPGYGHIYVCGPNEHRSGCVAQMANQFGFLDTAGREQLETALSACKQRISGLEQELAMYKQIKDVQAFLRKRQTRTITPEEVKA